jgi:heme exporter protein D
MWFERESFAVWIAVLVQVIGIIGVTVARLSQRRGAGGVSGAIALACVVLVGGFSLSTMETCGRCWLVFAITLPLMAVGATLDVRKSGAHVAF